MNFNRKILSALVSSLVLAGTPASASTWPDSIFDGAAPQVIAEVHAHEDLVQEAEGYLSSCDGMDADTEQACLAEQYQFIMDYIYAVYNEYSSQQNIAAELSGDGEPPKFTGLGAGEPGINVDLVRGCAWREAVIVFGSAGFMNNSLDEYKMDCYQLSALDQQAANDMVYGILMPEIRTHLLKGDAPLDIYTGYKAGEAPRGPSN